MANTASATHHVHFVEEREEHESGVIVTPVDDIRISVYVGFLKVNHLYTIQFPVKDSLGSFVVADSHQNGCIRIVKADAINDGHELLLECKTENEKEIKEELVLSSGTNPQKFIVLVVQARVLGKDQGTPTLRHGVHCSKSYEEKLPVFPAAAPMEQSTEESDFSS